MIVAEPSRRANQFDNLIPDFFRLARSIIGFDHVFGYQLRSFFDRGSRLERFFELKHLLARYTHFAILLRGENQSFPLQD